MPQRTGFPSILTDRRFLAAASGGSLVVLIAGALAPMPLQIAVVGVIASLTLGMLVIRRDGDASPDSDIIQQTFLIAKDRDAFRHHQCQTRSLARCVEHADPLFRSLALKRFGVLATVTEEISRGNIVYEDTETWRLVYEQLLRSPGLHLYRSAALVTSAAYWQDEPGRQSMRLNFEMQHGGTLTIERTVIVADPFWAANEDLPSEPLRRWIDEQHDHGILLRLVRLSALANEPDLQADFGIYGTRAVGVQELSPFSRTLRFNLSFDFDRVRDAEERWARLTVYATIYPDLLKNLEFDL